MRPLLAKSLDSQMSRLAPPTLFCTFQDQFEFGTEEVAIKRPESPKFICPCDPPFPTPLPNSYEPHSEVLFLRRHSG